LTQGLAELPPDLRKLKARRSSGQAGPLGLLRLGSPADRDLTMFLAGKDREFADLPVCFLSDHSSSVQIEMARHGR
jgi:hypothetical protein